MATAATSIPTTIDDLPESHLSAMRTPEFKAYATASIFDIIRRTSPTASYAQLISAMSQLKTMVGIVDDPKAIQDSSKEQEAMDEEKKRIQDLIS